VLQVSIDANTDRPWMGRSFKLKLPKWAEDNRARIIHALLTIARGWMVAGRPVTSSSWQDSYDDYVAGVRGLLDFAGFDGTFDDSATQGEIVAEDDDDLGEFLRALDEAPVAGTFTAADITHLLEWSNLSLSLPTELREKWERCNGRHAGFTKALGKWLKANEGRFADGRKIINLGKDRNKVTQWKLVTS